LQLDNGSAKPLNCSRQALTKSSKQEWSPTFETNRQEKEEEEAVTAAAKGEEEGGGGGEDFYHNRTVALTWVMFQSHRAGKMRTNGIFSFSPTTSRSRDKVI
jgi:hypothetical protein